jgi:hypothetical protein
MRIVFLHIPKTAGQSVHAALEAGFGSGALCPARVNEQLKLLSRVQLNRYQVFSGHFDWNHLDCLKGPVYSFTVLRDPVERILSFYFFLRKQGMALSDEDRAKPGNQGMRAAVEMTPREYFTAGPPHLRNFLDEHYDNFYTYYFAGRSYRGRSDLFGQVKRGALSRQDLLSLARDNLSQVSEVFTVDNMAPVFERIRQLSGKPLRDDESYRTNVNAAEPSTGRLARLQALGADQVTLDRIAAWCDMDRELFADYARAPVPMVA